MYFKCKRSSIGAALLLSRTYISIRETCVRQIGRFLFDAYAEFGKTAGKRFDEIRRTVLGGFSVAGRLFQSRTHRCPLIIFCVTRYGDDDDDGIFMDLTSRYFLAPSPV